MNVSKAGRHAALALTVAALAAPAAQAMRYIEPGDDGGSVVRADDRPGIRGPGASSVDPAYLQTPTTATRPDNRAGFRGIDPAQVPALGLVAPDAIRPDDRGGVRGASGKSGGGFATSVYGAPSAISSAPPTSGPSAGAQPLHAPQVTHGAIRPDNRDGLRGVDPMAVSVSEGGGFDWGDAGIGAISAFGLAFLAGGMLAGTHLRQHRQDGIAAL